MDLSSALQIVPGASSVFFKIIRVMKLCLLMLLAGVLQVYARADAQKITFNGKKVSFDKVIKVIKNQTGYVTFYDYQLLKEAPVRDAHFKQAALSTVLDKMLQDLPYSYTIEGKTIYINKNPAKSGIAPKNESQTPPVIQQRIVKIHIMDSTGMPLVGATVMTLSDKKYQQTDNEGNIRLENPDPEAQIAVSFIGYANQTLKLGDRTTIIVVLKVSNNPLDEVQLIAYGTTTRRLNTGSVGHVSSEEIEKQPVTNVLQALQGRVPGLMVTQSGGYGSAPFKVRIRGENSITFASDPLFIIDGVPMMAGSGDTKNNGLNQSSLISGIGQSPIFSVNPSDIASIDILKDADATAIYGSQGANGVILITTKKGQPGKTKFGVNYYNGFGKVTRLPKLLNTEQYLAMRKEAFENDGLEPTLSGAPDLLRWDQNRYTDWQKVLLGNTARITDAQVNISGGDTYTQYRISGGYHKQTNITTTEGADKRGSMSLSLNTMSKDRKFTLGFTGNYSHGNTDMITMDNSLTILPPNAPSIFDKSGNLNFDEWGSYSTGFLGNASNPFGPLLQPYAATTDNLQSNLRMEYKPIKSLTFRATGGYSSLSNDQNYQKPLKSFNPTSGQKSSSLFGKNSVKTWIIEPQVEYMQNWGQGRLDILLGSTFQSTQTNSSNIGGTGFSNEALLGSLEAAKDVTIYIDKSVPYRYQAVFGRINYNWAHKYIVNATARRDGSSRFGPGNQFGNFGALGAAWIFSETEFIKKQLPILSFGKLRTSYGSTGSANIGDYQFLSQWEGDKYPYDGIATLSPTGHYNPDYGWEKNKKIEIALDLGFFNDNLHLDASWYRNRSDNQLVSIPLPVYTGFTSVTANLPATVQNTGWEFSLSSTNINKKGLRWNTSFNITLPDNKLLSFPGLATSTYALQYEIGQPLTLKKLIHFIRIDPATGNYEFEDINHDGKYTTTGLSNDLQGLYNSSPVFFGGLNNAFTYKNWQLSFLFQFTKQKGFLYNYGLAVPGSINNQSTAMLDRWKAPGDITGVPKLSTILSSDYIRFTNSDAGLVDASYARLQNLSLAYALPEKLIKRFHAAYTKIYIQGQNLLTLTGYKGADPETQNLTSIPPVKFITAGIQITF